MGSRGRSGAPWALAAAVAALAALAWAAPGRTQARSWEDRRERFEGTWRLAYAPSRGQRIVDRAIDRAVAAMPFFSRPIARPMLRDATPVNRRLTLRFSDDRRITIRFDDRDRYTTRVGETSGRYRTGDGDPMRITQRFQADGALEQVFQTEDGTRWYVWRSIGDDRVRVHATTQGDMMPQPMRYALEYER
ncbi:MAG TPA: hypothetical protein RMH99_02305 [Sandaracinaceae bacterium LLY-WYZ-13_1]|nr:hypothetical protein [Sandaracinaceae bacterium LLY-WYZ-13_1]